MSRTVDDTTREMLEGALFQFQFMALMSQAGRSDEADAAYAKGMTRLAAVLAEPEPEPDDSRWRAERRWHAAADRDELDLY
jgi:hypothetical protein|tara:strand:+ start:127 stop:369 length:243 start_codon:yes stop_codon:yes gene_type:complete